MPRMQERPHGAVDLGDLGKDEPQKLIADSPIAVRYVNQRTPSESDVVCPQRADLHVCDQAIRFACYDNAVVESFFSTLKNELCP